MVVDLTRGTKREAPKKGLVLGEPDAGPMIALNNTKKKREKN